MLVYNFHILYLLQGKSMIICEHTKLDRQVCMLFLGKIRKDDCIENLQFQFPYLQPLHDIKVSSIHRSLTNKHLVPDH